MSDAGKGAKVSQPSRATDKVGAFAGVSGRHLEGRREIDVPSEINAIRRALAPIEKAAAKQRMREHGGTAPGKQHSAKLSQSVRATDRLGAFAGVSGRTVEKIAEVVEAAEADELVNASPEERANILFLLAAL